MRRRMVLRLLVLGVVLVSFALPLTAAAGPRPLYVRGYVKDDCNEGLIGARVEIVRVQSGVSYGPSVVKNVLGSWGVMLTGTYGEYQINVDLSGVSGDYDPVVVAWGYGQGAAEMQIAGGVDSVRWWVDPMTYYVAARNPLTIYTNAPCGCCP